MKRLEEGQLEAIAKFMRVQFWNRDELLMFKGIEEQKQKNLVDKLNYYDFLHMFKNGDIFIYDDNITGAIIGIESKNNSILKKVPTLIEINKILNSLSEEDITIIKNNQKKVKEFHNSKWFKKFCKNPYYIAQFAIDESMRGKGIARKMLEDLFGYVKQKTNYIVLETLAESTVPMYEHFGFKLMETAKSKDGEVIEYRMLKKLS